MRASAPESRPSFVVTALLVAAGVALWLGLWAQLFLALGMKRRFDEFGLKLPSLTEFVVDVANLAWTNWRLVLPPAVFAALVWGGFVGWLRHRHGWIGVMRWQYPPFMDGKRNRLN